jgi:predicted GIY-YIG superfamily endonuclease
MWFCYILKSTNARFLNHTYIGITTSCDKRLLQHNGHLTGGAKCTRMKRPWTFLCIVSGFIDRSSVSSFEKQLKLQKVIGINEKIKTVSELVQKWNNDDKYLYITFI